jgi:ligand-binding sensor domain-containing protein
MRNILLYLILINLTIASNQYNIQYYSVDDGLSQSQVMSIDQDENGYIWIGTRNGLNRFDGREFLHYYKNISKYINSNSIWKIEVDNSNRVWVATERGFYRITVDHEGNITEGIGPFLEDTIVFDLCIDESNNCIYVATSIGVYKFNNIENPNSEEIIIPKINDKYFFMVKILSNGDIIVAASDFIFYRIDKYGEVFRIESEASAAKNIIETPDGRSLLATFSGIAELKDDKIALKKNLIKGIKDFYWDLDYQDGQLWVGSYADGLAVLDDNYNLLHHFGAEEISPAIKDIYIDFNNNVWVGTDGGGISVISKSNFENYTTKNGLGDNMIWSLKGDLDREILYVGTWNGIYKIENNVISTLKDVNERLFNLSINSIEISSDGGIYVGTDYTLNYISPDYSEVKAFEKSELLIDENSMVVTLKYGPNGILWLGKDYQPSIIGIQQNGEIISHEFGLEFDDNIVKDIEFDSNGNMWVLGDYHIGFKNKFWSTYEIKDVRLIDLEITHDDRILVGTDEGVWIFNEERFVPYECEVDRNTTVYFIKESTFDNLWFGTVNGVFNEVNGKSIKYTINDGLAGNETNAKAIELSLDGSIYIGTVNGLSRYQKNGVIEDAIPTLHISALQTSNENFTDFSSNLLLKNSTMRYQFKYGSVYFDQNANVEYMVRLLGLDDNWTRTKSKEMVYGHLSKGEYIFQAKAILPSEIKSVIDEVRFRVTPYFFESKVVIIIFGFILGIILTMIIFKVKAKNEIDRQNTIDIYFFNNQFKIRLNNKIQAGTIITSKMVRTLFEVIIIYNIVENDGIAHNKIIELFWPDKTQKESTNRRNVAITKIRSLFNNEVHGQAIINNHHKYYFDFNNKFINCDIARFNSSFLKGDDFVKKQNIKKAIKAYSETVTIIGEHGLLNEMDNPLILEYQQRFKKQSLLAAKYIIDHENVVSDKIILNLCHKIVEK